MSSNPSLPRCKRCGSPWDVYSDSCPSCGSFGERPLTVTPTNRAQPTPTPFAPIEPASGHRGNPVHVRAIDLNLSWANVFEIVFKFTVAFLVIDAVILIGLALLIAALVD